MTTVSEYEGALVGVVVRIVAKVGASVREWFIWMRETPEDPEAFAANFAEGARLVGAFEIEAPDGWGPFPVYIRDVGDLITDDPAAVVLFRGNRALDTATVTVNLAQIDPIDEAKFWALLDTPVADHGSREYAMRHALEDLQDSDIHAFYARLEALARALDTAAVLGIAGADYVRGLRWVSCVEDGRDLSGTYCIRSCRCGQAP